MQSGRFDQKTHLHDMLSMMKAPVEGPRKLKKPQTPAEAPCTRARSLMV